MRITLFTLFISTLFQAVLSNPSDTSLAVLSRQANLELGSAFYHRAGWDTSEYNGHFLDNFTHLTPEGGMVWGELGISPSPGQINFGGGDRWIGFAHQNGLKVKAHHLVWHRYFEGHDPLLPSWIIDDTGTVHYNKDELSDFLKDFITKTVTHYNSNFPGTVKWWCVANEAGSNTTGFTKNLWIDSLGVSHIDSAFIWAREAAGPDIKLFYNDYFYHGLGWDGARMPLKIDFAYQTISALQQRGVPIDGMGFQTHLNTVCYPGKS